MLHNPNAQAQRATFPECLMKTNLQHPQQKYLCYWDSCTLENCWPRPDQCIHTQIRLSHRVWDQGFGTGNFLPACTSWQAGKENSWSTSALPWPPSSESGSAEVPEGTLAPPAAPASPVSSGNRAPSPEHSSCNLLKQKYTFRLFHTRQGEDGALLWDNTQSFSSSHWAHPSLSCWFWQPRSRAPGAPVGREALSPFHTCLQ